MTFDDLWNKSIIMPPVQKPLATDATFWVSSCWWELWRLEWYLWAQRVLPEPISSSCRFLWCSACNCGSLGSWSSQWGRPPSPGWERSITVNRNIVWKPVVERWHVKDHLHRVEQTKQWLLHLARILKGRNLMILTKGEIWWEKSVKASRPSLLSLLFALQAVVEHQDPPHIVE